MGHLRKLLFPFSLLYAGIISVRNQLYNTGVFRSQAYDFPVICVGNLSVGGTGKSPMIETLISLLEKEYRLATLSRGYKRTTKGFLLLDGTETAKEVGDEPLQFKQKFPEVMVAVDEQRRRGIEELRVQEPRPEVILLDDAFQHRAVSAGLNILLTSYGKLYSNDLVLPAGDLRESKTGAKRAELVVVTKCPVDLREDEKRKIEMQLELLPGQELYFSSIAYEDQVYSAGEGKKLQTFVGKQVILVTGIANPEPLKDYLLKIGLQFTHREFPDHHNFTQKELKELREEEFILTTEKDYMRLKESIPEEKLFYLPIRMVILGEGEAQRFNTRVLEYALR